jgi:hypothetical protein
MTDVDLMFVEYVLNDGMGHAAGMPYEQLLRRLLPAEA